MARGVRKTAMEKLTEQLMEVQDSIRQYEESLETLREKEKELQEDMERERFREITGMMREKEISMEELKAWIADR